MSTRWLRQCVDKRRCRQEREERDAADRAMRRQRQRYGRTPKGEWIDMAALTRLSGLGYSRPLAAEALRQARRPLPGAMHSIFASGLMC